MSYVITTPITPGFLVQAKEVVNTLIAATNERLVAVGSAYFVNWDTVTAPTVVNTLAPGDVMQGSNLWAAFPTITFPHLMGLQVAITGLVGDFIDYTVTSYEGATTPPVVLDMPAARVLAGLPTTLTRPVTPGVPDNTAWRRQRPREILDTTVNADVQGNSFALGQLAYLTGSNASGRVWCGELAKCTSVTNNPTGNPFGLNNWGLMADLGLRGVVDILDNTLDYPNAIAIDLHPFDAGVIGSVKSGDYLGSIVFEEVRCLVNVLRTQIINPLTFTSTTSPPGGFAGAWQAGTDLVSFTGAVAAAATGWPVNNTGGTLPTKVESYVYGNYSGVIYTAQAGVEDATYQVTLNTATTKDIDWYIMGIPTTAEGNLPVGGVFDAEGFPVTNGSFHLWHSDTGVATTPFLSPQFGNSNIFPPNAPPAPTVGTDTALGFELSGAFAIVKNNFVYEF